MRSPNDRFGADGQDELLTRRDAVNSLLVELSRYERQCTLRFSEPRSD